MEVPAVPVEVMQRAPAGESSATIRARDVAAHGRMTPPAVRLLTAALTELHLSARSYTKIVTVARTIADLSAHETIRPDDVAEAIQ